MSIELNMMETHKFKATIPWLMRGHFIREVDSQKEYFLVGGNLIQGTEQVNLYKIIELGNSDKQFKLIMRRAQ